MSAIAALLLITAVSSSAAPRERPVPEATLHGILGVNVGMTVDAARARLRALGTMDVRPTREGGTKEVCRLESTGFSWIAFKAGADGRVVWITGQRRQGQEIPFERLAPTRPTTTTDTIAIWHTDGVRVTARGRDRRAQVMTLMADSD